MLVNLTAKITNHIFQGPLSVNTKRAQVCHFSGKMDSGMDTGEDHIDAVEVMATVDVLEFDNPL